MSRDILKAILNLDHETLEGFDEDGHLTLAPDLPNYIDPHSLPPVIENRDDWREYYWYCRKKKLQYWNREKEFFQLFNKTRGWAEVYCENRILALHIKKNGLSWDMFYPDDDLPF